MKSGSRPDPPDLAAGEVHLWWSRADSGSEPGVLSEDETARAARFHRDRDRRRFRHRRAELRVLLGAYAGADPASLSFVQGPHGKPALAGRALGGWSFNLSHSEEYVLIAVARSMPLGVDVQSHRLRTDLGRMARQVFSPAELSEFAEIDAPHQLIAFFRVWTRKEAALKATGDGLARDPRTLHVGTEARAEGERWVASDPSLDEYAFEAVDAPADASACLVAPRASWERTRVVRPRPDEPD